MDAANFECLNESMDKKTKATAKKTIAPRATTRFKPDPLTSALLFPKINSETCLLTLVLNESQTGCALLINTEDGFKKGQKVVVKVGNLHELTSEVIWVTEIDENIFKLGLKYLE